MCPLVIKLFSPSLKYRQGLPPPPSPAPVEKPFFPIVMRLLRIVGILIKNFYSLLVSLCSLGLCFQTLILNVLVLLFLLLLTLYRGFSTCMPTHTYVCKAACKRLKHQIMASQIFFLWSQKNVV